MFTRGIERMSRGLSLEVDRLDLISQNLANTNTPGFRSVLFGQRQEETLDRWLDGTTPAPQETGRGLDVYPPEGSFFQVQRGAAAALTRRGDLRVDSNSILVVGSGEPILSTAGTPIKIDGTRSMEISPAGEVLQEGKVVATIARVKAERPRESGGSSIFNIPGGAPLAPSTEPIKVGALDSSDVDPQQNAARLTETLARARLLQGFATTQDQTVEQAIRDLGSSR